MSPWSIAALASIVVSAVVLVLVFRWDERLDRTVDPEYHWLYPGIDCANSIVKLTIRLFLMAVALGFGALFVWNGLAPGAGWARLSIPLVDVPLAEMPRYALFHKVVFGWVAVLFVVNVVRCVATPLHDIFISYKSEDVVLARRIADALIAAGWRVWFAEYQVLLQRRERFRLAILRGTFGTRFALALTNDRWAQSEHCAYEIHALLKALEPAQILEVRVPRQALPHRLCPPLARSPFLESEDVGKVLTFITQATGVSARRLPLPVPPNAGRRYQAHCGGRPCSLLVEGWTLHASGAAADGSLNGQTFRYDGAEEGRLFVNVHSGPEVSREG